VGRDRERLETGADDALSEREAHSVHEAANALTVILGWIARARRTRDPRTLDRALERAARHARGARDAMRRAIGAQVQSGAPERIDELVERVLDDLAIEAEQARITTMRAIEPTWARRYVEQADATWQILTNLLLNAIAATPAGGQVTLEVGPSSRGPGWVEFGVTDEGPGVAAERQASLFHDGQSEREGGAGIGLRCAHVLARRCGGELQLGQAARGARFELFWRALPAAQQGAHRLPSEPAPPQSASPEPILHGRSILVLEDDDAVVELLELALGSRGASITPLRSADALLSAVRSGRFDTLLADLSPLAGDARRLLDQVQKAAPDMAVVVMSGTPATIPELATSWLQKPFDPAQLVELIVRAQPTPSEAET